MHIVLLSHEYPPFIFGGVGAFVKDLAQGISRRGMQVTVVSGYPTRVTSLRHLVINKDDENGISVVRFPYPQIPPRHLMFQIVNFKALSKIVQSLNPDIIHGQSASTFPAILNLRHISPVVVTFHSSPRLQMISTLQSLTRGGSFKDFYTFGLGYPLWEHTFREEFRKSDASVAVSETLMSELSMEMGSSVKRFLCIKNGIDLKLLESSSSDSNNTEGDPVIFFGGRLYWSKGVFNLLKLAYVLQKRSALNMRIVIYGSGPLYKTILSEKQRLNLTNLELKPFASRTEFIERMRQATFVVIPSFYESCPMVLLECMCLGKVPVLFNVPFAREFTKDGKYGILAASVQDMATKIERMYVEGYVEQSSNKIRDFAEKEYDIKETAQQYQLTYKRLLN